LSKTTPHSQERSLGLAARHEPWYSAASAVRSLPYLAPGRPLNSRHWRSSV